MRRTLDEGEADRIGPYKHAHRIAVGGMAEVFRALSPQTAGGDRAVVIKQLLPELAEDATQRAMFVREAELGARIDHPNVVEVLEHGTAHDRPYIALEYVFGVDLFRLCRWMRHERKRFTEDLALFVGCELLAGLEAVHRVTGDDGTALEVVHRDVSPANVFLSVHGEVKLGDLGIARTAPGREGAVNRAKGKLGYLPPEQVAGHSVDQRGDVFSAAVVIAELLMGKPLFAGATEIGVLLAIRDGDISAFRAIAPSLPAPVVGALESALAKRPRARTKSAEALRERLVPVLKRPRPELRHQLGALVVAAMDAELEPRDETSLARTIEQEARIYEQITPAAPTDPDVLRDSGPLFRIDRDDAPLGIYTLATLIRGLTMGEVRPTDTVRGEEGGGRSIASVAELARHLPASTRTPAARSRTGLRDTSESYDLGQQSLFHVLLDARRRRERGLMLCERGDARKEIYLTDGTPVFATSNRPEDMLGERLVTEGLIDRAELDMALAIMPRFEGRLGETLIALGLVEPVRLFHSIGEQVKERVLDAFVWTEGRAALYRHVDPPERAFPLELDPWDLLLEGLGRRIGAGLEPRLPHEVVLGPGAEDPRAFALSERLTSLTLACQRPRRLTEQPPPSAALEAAARLLLELDVLTQHG